MMRYRAIWLICLIFLTVVSASAQHGGEWFVAWKPDEESLISFTPDGEVNTLIDSDVTGEYFRTWRMDDGSVLIFITIKTEGALYHITRTSAQPILLPSGDFIDWVGGGWRLVAQDGNYAALVNSSEFPAGAAIVINLDTNTATRLEHEVAFSLPDAAAFSQDGAYFRYVGRPSPDSQTWSIREYELETGNEQVIYTLADDPLPLVSADSYGEQWIYRHRLATTMITDTGEAQTIEYESPEAVPAQMFLNDDLVMFPLDCKSGCVMELKPLSDGEPLRFDVPDSESNFIANVFAEIDESHLLVFMDVENLWLLSTDGNHELLGRWSPQIVVNPPDKLLSPDHRWLLTMEESEESIGYQVWDLQSHQIVMTGDAQREFHILQIWYSKGGFIVAEDSQYFQYFRYSDQHVFDLGEPDGMYWEALADGTLLYTPFGDSSERAQGIYRYDPDADSYTSLVAGAVIIRIEDVV